MPEDPAQTKLDTRSKELRKKMIGVLASAGRGHLPSAFSLVEMLRVLYDGILRYEPKNPKWDGRDRFILSKGHGCIALYVILAEKGFFPEKELSTFCRLDSILGGHPHHTIPGVEVSTGSLGHGPSIGIGFALNAKYGKQDTRTYVVIGDGESDEGSVWEAALSAGKHKLDNFIVLVDYNKRQSYDSTFNVQDLEPFADKWRSFGFEVREVNGHDVDALGKVLREVPFRKGKPNAIICHTVKGKGIATLERDYGWHHKRGVTHEDAASLLRELEEY